MKLKLVLILAILLALCSYFAATAQAPTCGDSGDCWHTATPTVTQTQDPPTATATLEPTATPVPTETATATMAPTETPAPTWTPFVVTATPVTPTATQVVERPYVIGLPIVIRTANFCTYYWCYPRGQ